MDEKLIGRKDLCDKIGMQESSLRTYITRGKIRESQHGYVDLDDEFNKAYLLKWAGKKGMDISYLFEIDIKPKEEIKIPEKKTPKDPPKKSTSRKIVNDNQYDQAVKNKTIYEAEVKKTQAEINRIELEKKKGKVIPSEFVQEMMQRYVNGTFGDVINSGNKLIDELCNEIEASIEIKLKYKKQLNEVVTDILKTKHKFIKDEIVEIAKEFALRTKW